jgi:hypothetical protein
MKITSSCAVTGEPNPSLNGTPFFLIVTGLRFWDFRRWVTDSLSSASMTPLRISPVRARASQTHSAMVLRELATSVTDGVQKNQSARRNRQNGEHETVCVAVRRDGIACATHIAVREATA